MKLLNVQDQSETETSCIQTTVNSIEYRDESFDTDYLLNFEDEPSSINCITDSNQINQTPSRSSTVHLILRLCGGVSQVKKKLRTEERAAK